MKKKAAVALACVLLGACVTGVLLGYSKKKRFKSQQEVKMP